MSSRKIMTIGLCAIVLLASVPILILTTGCPPPTKPPALQPPTPPGACPPHDYIKKAKSIPGTLGCPPKSACGMNVQDAGIKRT